MLVRNWMSKKVITIDADESMHYAMGLLKKNNIRMLPVMKKGRLAGILTDGDIKKASASDATTLDIHELFYLLAKIKVKDIMTRKPITVTPDWTVEETAELLLQNKISGAPVLGDREAVVGVITQSDIFRVLISLTGIQIGGVQFGIRLEDRPGSIKEVADIIRASGGRMVSILTSYDNVPDGFRNVYIRMHGIKRSRLAELKQALAAKATLLYIIDHRENQREIFPERAN